MSRSLSLALVALLWLTTGMSHGAIVFEGEIPSAILKKPRKIHIYLPPDYEKETRRRYPVLYVHDGQNAFSTAGPGAAFGWGPWDLDKTVDRLIGEKKIEPIIMVAIDCSNERYKEYRGPKAWRKAGANGDLYENYTRFLIEELKPKIDREYRTKKTAADTGTIGSSMGAVVGLALGWEHPDVFGKIAGLSGAFQVESKAAIKSLREYDGKKKKLKIFLDSGSSDYTGGDDGLADTEAVVKELRRIGYKKDLLHHIDHGLTAEQLVPYHLSDGKAKEAVKSHHNEFYWRLRAPRALEFLFPPK
jgi:predicted alpha/beta superfamily hydrolase